MERMAISRNWLNMFQMKKYTKKCLERQIDFFIIHDTYYIYKIWKNEGILNKYYNQMNRNIPIGNKICATKEIFLNQNILNQHIQTMRPQVRISAPKQYDFLKNRKIKDAIKQQKQQEINRENQNLIFKLNNIMQQQQSNSISALPIRKSTFSSYAQKKSLNKECRKKELIKIVMENQQLLKRIQDQKSQYNVKDWNEERKFVEKQIANISEFPYKDFKPTKTMVKFQNNNSSIKREISKKLDPLVDTRNLNNKQIIDENNTELKLFLSATELEKKSLFESDFKPYEPCKDEQLEKIVNSLVEGKREVKEEEQNHKSLDQNEINPPQNCVVEIDEHLSQSQQNQENKSNNDQDQSQQIFKDEIIEPIEFQQQQQDEQLQQSQSNNQENQEVQTIENFDLGENDQQNQQQDIEKQISE